MRSKRDPMTVRLWRENVRLSEPSVLKDVGDIVALGFLVLICVAIAILVMA